MTTIVTRASNGVPLTNNQMDTNLTNLNNDKAENSAVALKANIDSPSFSGVPIAPTAVAGTNTDQIATTKFVTTSVPQSFPFGTRMLFAQASAPSGWTQDVTATLNDRMLRVVNTAGGSNGGTDSPILMNVVPSHTHPISASASSTESASHTHTIGITTSSESAAHNHGVGDPGHTHNITSKVGSAGTGIGGLMVADTSSTESPSTRITTVNTATGINIGNNQSNHTHNVIGTSASNSTSHTHTMSGTAGTNTGAVNWTPKYIDVIICSKA